MHTLTPPRNEWLEMVEYRGYWDFPRFILALDSTGNYWILDDKFDDDLDDYASDFTIFSAGTSAAEAAEMFDRIGKSLIEGTPVDRHPAHMVQFDRTQRKQVLLKE